MKKYAVFLGLIFTTLIVLSSCDTDDIIKKDGTFEVTNEDNKLSVEITIKKDFSKDTVVTKKIAANMTEKIQIREDGAYSIEVIYDILTVPVPGKTDPLIIPPLIGGNTVKVKVSQVL